MPGPTKPGAPTSPVRADAPAADGLTRAIFDQAAEAILVCDPRGVITRASRAAVALVGRNCLHEQLSTALPLEIEGIGRAERLLVRVLGGESFHAVEARLPRPSSDEARWLLVSAAPLRGEGDLGCVVSLVDITARRAADAALRVSEERYRTLVDLAPDAIVVHQAGAIVYANSAALRLFGATSPDDLIGMSISDRSHPEGRLLAQARTREAERGRTTPLLEQRMLRLDGTPIEVETTGSATEYEHAPAVQVIIRDIGARKRAEAALLEGQALLRAVIENAGDSIYVKDRDGRILLANPALARVAGKPIEAIVGRTDAEYYADAAAGRTLREHDLLVMESARALSVEETVTTPEGARTFLSAKAPYRNAAGEVIGIVGISRDITERKRAEAFRTAVAAVHRAVLSTRDAAVVMEAVLAEGAGTLGCDTAAISLREGDRWVVRHALGFAQDVIGATMSDEEEPHAVLAVRTRKPVAIDDALEDGRVNRDHMGKWGVRSVLVVPLLTEREAAGVVFFNFRRRRVTFTEADVAFASQLAAAASLALENARLFAELQHELAEHRRAEDALRELSQRLSYHVELLPAGGDRVGTGHAAYRAGPARPSACSAGRPRRCWASAWRTSAGSTRRNAEQVAEVSADLQDGTNPQSLLGQSQLPQGRLGRPLRVVQLLAPGRVGATALDPLAGARRHRAQAGRG